MTKGAKSVEAAIREEVRLVPYDPRWPQAFAAERDRLALAIGPRLLAIEHLGSTAVVGMSAKPIIDILAGVESMVVADALVEPILAAGYTMSREFNATLTDRRWFMRSAGGKRTHHLHLVVLGSEAWSTRLAFRDRLRASPDLARRYAALKAELADRFRNDRETYTESKSDFIAAAVASRDEGAGSAGP